MTGIFLLDWATLTEVNNYGFEIERRAVNSDPDTQIGTQAAVNNWRPIGFIKGSGTSNSAHDYTYTNATLKPGGYVYRLKQIDRDGNFEYSKEAEVIVAKPPSMFVLSQNYPNPFNPATMISFGLPSNAMVSLKVYDVLGREVSTLLSGELPAGTYSEQWSGEGLPSGEYFYRLQARQTSGGQPGVFTETKRLILLR